MRRVLLALGGSCVAILVLGLAALAVYAAGGHVSVPPGATDVRAESWRQLQSDVCQRVSYHLPPAWSLLDQYAYLESRGMARDRDRDRELRRSQAEWQSSTFAVFVQWRWLGLLAERATVAIAPNGHPRPQVHVERCLRGVPWVGWM